MRMDWQNSESNETLFMTTIIRKKQHGMAHTSEYNIWRQMKQRCQNPNCDAFASYGGRGIKVCARWLECFENFFADMGKRPSGLTLERKDNSGNYEPGNCVWATRKDQVRNMRRNRSYTHNGQTKTQAEWCSIYNIDAGTLRYRLKCGMTFEQAVTTQKRLNQHK